MTSQKIVVISSADQLVAAKTDFRYTLPAIITASSFKIASIHVPNVPYNVVTGRNDACTFDDGSARSVTVPAGFYTLTELLTTLQTLINAIPPTGVYTLSYSTNTQLVTVAVSVGTVSITNTAAGQIWTMLGFPRSATVAAASATATYTPKMIDFFYQIRSMELTRSIPAPVIYNSSCGSTMIARVANNVDHGSMLIKNLDDQIEYKLRAATTFVTIDLQLLTEAGLSLDLMGLDWSICIIFE